MGLRTGTSGRGDVPTRRGRHSARAGTEADELGETARRRLRSALGSEQSTGTPVLPDAAADVLVPAGPDLGAVGGWVPQPPPGAVQLPPVGARAAWPAALRDRLPPGLQSVLVAPGGRALLGLLLVVAVAVGTTAATAWVARPQEQRPPGRGDVVGQRVDPSAAGSTSTASAAATGSQPAAPTGTAAVVLVHVAGAVRRPGLVELAAGSRVADAVDAAGGVTRAGDPASVNLARPVVDGEQVVVARRGQAAPPPVAGQSGSAVGPGPAVAPIDLNTATLEQLDGLPGIGPVLAQRILDWRTANGRFSVVDELGEVSGIGEATLADLRPLVTV